jgi:hypothetical protein
LLPALKPRKRLIHVDTVRQQLVALAQDLSEGAHARGFDYISLGPALPEIPESYAAIPDALAIAQDVFLGGMLTDAAGASLPACACAPGHQQAAQISPDGLLTCVLQLWLMCPLALPFPSRLPRSGLVTSPGYRAAGLAVRPSEAATWKRGARQLGLAMESRSGYAKTARGLAEKHGVRFGGIDFRWRPSRRAALAGDGFRATGRPAVGLHGVGCAAFWQMPSTAPVSRVPASAA